MAEVASAYVSLLPSAKGFGSAASRQVDPQLAKAGKQGGGRFAAGLKAAIGPAVTLLGVAAVGGFLKGSIAEAREAQKVGALTTNVIKQTGGAANVTAKQVGSLATAISNKTGIDDEAIQSGANLLLTFKNVRNEAGKGSKVFDRATQAAADLSAAGFGDLAGTSKQLGKALNDPIKGISALGRAGVTFTEGQKAQIKAMVTAGDTLGAQKIILKEVESQVGGAAAASATSGEKAAVAFGNLKEALGTALLPVVDRVATFITTSLIPGLLKVGPVLATVGRGIKALSALVFKGDFTSQFRDIFNVSEDSGLVDAIFRVRDGIAGLFSILIKGDFTGAFRQAFNFSEDSAVVGFLLAARTAIIEIGVALKAGALAGLNGMRVVFAWVAANRAPVAAFFAVIGSAVLYVKTIALATKAWAAAQLALNLIMTANPIGLIVVAIAALVAGVVYAYQRFETFRNIVDSVFAAIRSAVDVALPYVKGIIQGNIDIILGIVKTFKSLFTGDWKGVWEGVKQILRGALTVVKTVVKAQFDAVVGIIRGIGPSILSAASAGFGKLKDGAQAGWDKAKDYVKGIPGKVMSALGDMGSLLLDAGKQAIAGLVSGMTKAATELIPGAVKSIADKISGGIKKALQIKSPSRVTTKLGVFIGQGLVNGLRDGTGGMDAYLNGLKKTITDSLSLKRTTPGMSKKQRAAVARFNDDARKAIKTQRAAVDQLAKSLAGLGKRIDDARANLNSLKDARASLADQTASSISGELSLTDTPNGKKLSFATVAANVSGLASRAKAFAGKLRALLAAGIPAGLVQEVASLGTVAGSSVADALLSGSQQQIGQLAADYAGIDTYSKQVGDIVAGSMYDAGIAAQEGILKGLLDDKAIQSSANQLAKKLTKAVKRALGIKSPSKVFQNEVGRYLPAGIVAGIDDGQRALDRRVAGMVSAVNPRDLRAGMDFAGGVAASAPTEQHFHLSAPAGTNESQLADLFSSRIMFKMTNA